MSKYSERIKPVVVAIIFGLGAFLIIKAKITISIPGTPLVSDPREILVTLGAAFTGPIGGVIIGLLSGLFSYPVIELNLMSAGIHMLGGLWMGFAYKKWVYEKLTYPALLVGWIGLVLVYYFAVLIPAAVFGTSFFPLVYQMMFRDAPPLSALANLATHIIPEAIITTLMTVIALAILPRGYRKPIW